MPPVDSSRLAPLTTRVRLLVRASEFDDTGFLTSRFSALPKSIHTVLGVWLILVALVLLAGGARLLFIARDLGKTRGSETRKGWLGGGVGGILFGSTLLGVVSTLATLLAVSRVSSTSLERWGTLAVMICPAVLGAIAGGRWSWVGKTSCGMLGSLSLSLLLITSLRLSTLTPRLALFFVLLALSTPLALLRTTEAYALPVCASFTAAYLFILGIDLFVHAGFLDALGLIVAKHGVSSTTGDAQATVVRWGSAGGKGLLATWCVCAAVGAAWQLYWGLGTEGDDIWNAYLAQFVSAHPSSPRGTHLPPASFFGHLRARFAPRSAFTDLPARRVAPWEDLNSGDEDAETPHLAAAAEKYHARPHTRATVRGNPERESDAWDSDADTLAGLASLRSGARSGKSGARSAVPARYGAVSASSDDEDDDGDADDDAKRGGVWSAASASMDAYVPPLSPREPGQRHSRPAFLARVSSGGLSGTTAVSTSGSKDGRSVRVGVVPVDEEQYMDGEDEERDAVLPLTSSSARLRLQGKGTVASRVSALLGRGKKDPAAYAGVELSAQLGNPTPPAQPHPHPRNTVPATPSLIKALDRVRTAQRAARGGAPLVRSPVDGAATRAPKVDGEHSRRASMDEWWAEVIRKSEGA